MMLEDNYWKKKSLDDLNPEEWEAICDGCGKCCLFKYREPGDKKVLFTNVVCRFMDLETCKCSDYLHRHSNVPDCVYLTPKIVRQANWLPKTCSYRVLAQQGDLPWWHPLKSGDSKSARLAGATVFGKVVSESEVDPEDMEDMVVNWFC